VAKFVMYIPYHPRHLGWQLQIYLKKNIIYLLLLSIISYYDHIDSADPCLGQPPHRVEG
jgi:hypothetical protein